MSLVSFLRSRFGRARLPAAPAPGKPTLEALEDRCLLATGVGVFLPDWGSWLLRSVPTAGAPTVNPFAYGAAHWSPVAGDWNGDGTDGIAVFNPTTATWYLRQQPTPGAPDIAPFAYGGVNWIPVAGDWDGDGRDSIGVFDPQTATWYLKNSNTRGAPDFAPFAYGGVNWIPVVGDWDGDGRDSIGVFDPHTATFYLRNSISPGFADGGIIRYGVPGWLPVVGDWNGDGRDSIGIFDPHTAAWYLKNSNTLGTPDVAPFRYGAPGWTPLAFDAPLAAPGTAPLPGTTHDTVITQPGGAQGVSVTLEAPERAEAPSFVVRVTAQASLGLSPQLLLDVDLDGDGAFASPGELAYATGTAQSSGQATITVSGLLPGASYKLRARASDLSGAAGISSVRQVRLDGVPSAYLPLAYEANLGQADGQARFLARASGYAAFLAPQGLYLSYTTPGPDGSGATVDAAQAVLFSGGNPAAPLTGEGLLAGKSNYFGGGGAPDQSALVLDVPSEPAAPALVSITNVPNYQRVRASGVWAGIDVVYRSDGGRLNYDFEVAPGADPSAITLALPWAAMVRVDGAGQLLVDSGSGQVAQSAPVAYQVRPDGSKQALASRYVDRGGNQVGFEVIGRDPARPLVIDPYIYNTFLGGSGDDFGDDIVADSAGNAYVTGRSQSTNFPTTNPLTSPNGSANSGQDDVVVVKLNSLGTARVFSTYLGGSNNDRGHGIAIDGASNVYITGETNSTNFPTQSAFQTASGGGVDAFVASIGAAGNTLTYSSYLGGSGTDVGRDIALDGANNAYVTGETSSNNFPTSTGAFQATAPGGGNDAFVAKINSSGNTRVWSTYLGGSGDDRGTSIALDSSTNVYVTGRTSSNNFPTQGALQGARAGGDDVFVSKLNPNGTGLVYSTYFGGTGDDRGFALALAASGNVFVTGSTNSNGLATAGVVQSTRQADDAFVLQLNSAGNGTVYFTYLGGSGNEVGNGIAVDSFGNAYLAGSTTSNNFPTASPLQANANGNDAFVSLLNGNASQLAFSTYLGGNQTDTATGLALDPGNNIYVVGQTNSTASFPTTAGVVQGANAGGNDFFVAKIAAVVLLPPPPPPGPPPPPPNPPPDIFELNDTSDAPTNLGLNSTTVSLTGLSISRHDNGLFDQDWFRLTSGLSNVTVSLSNIQASGGDLHVRVFIGNPNGTLTLVASSTQTGGVGTQLASAAITPGTPIYVWVFGFNFALGTYDLAISFT